MIGIRFQPIHVVFLLGELQLTVASPGTPQADRTILQNGYYELCFRQQVAYLYLLPELLWAYVRAVYRSFMYCGPKPFRQIIPGSI